MLQSLMNALDLNQYITLDMNKRGYRIFNVVYGIFFISVSMILIWISSLPLTDRLWYEGFMVFTNIFVLYYLQDARMGTAKMHILNGFLALGVLIMILVLSLDDQWRQVFKYLFLGQGKSAIKQLDNVHGDPFVLVGLVICYMAVIAIVRRAILFIIDRYCINKREKGDAT
jgi:hypothetical protein